MRLPKHLFFNRPSAPSHPPHPATPPPAAHSSIRMTTPPPPTYTEATSPRSHTRCELRQSMETGRPIDMGVSVRTEPCPAASATADGREEPCATTVTIEDPNVIVLFLEDYRRTKEYVRELEWKVALRKTLRRNLYKWYALLVIVITISALLSVKHEDVVHFCAPVTKRIREWPGGWLIPLALLIIVSFPPLVGHEIIGILCGLVWGLGLGFAILAAGTFLGEIATWIAFKWFCTARAVRFEKKNKLYASLTQLIREKSFMFVLVLRFSAVPGHITTAVSASAGANFWSYLAAAFLTLPKQLTIAYLGTAFGTKSRKNTIISVITTIMTLIGTVVAAVYIYYQMRLVMRRQPTTIPALPTTMQEAACLSLDLSSSTLDRRATVATVAGIKSAPYENSGKSNAEIWQNELHARRPWLFSNLSGRTLDDKGGLSRARSLPGPMNDVEMRGWLSKEGAGTGAGSEVERETGTSTPMIRLDSDHGSRPPSRLLLSDLSPAASVAGSSRLATLTTDDMAITPNYNPIPEEDGTYPPFASASSSRYVPRGTMSLEIPRSPTQRLGGREIADDADMFAVSRGARRPDYGRSRGESRAALLGRPDWDERSDVDVSTGESSHRGRLEAFKAERDDKPKVDDVLLKPLQNPGRSGMSGVKEREYGRSRGESGAALLGRPDLD